MAELLLRVGASKGYSPIVTYYHRNIPISKDDVLKALQSASLSLLLDIYNIAAYYSSRENTQSYLNAFDFRSLLTYRLEHLMMLERSRRLSAFVDEAIMCCSHECINNHGKQDKTSKDDVELVVTSENSPETFDSSKKTFNLISAFIEFFVIFPWVNTIFLRRNNRSITKLFRRGSHVIALVCTIHEK